MRRNMISVLMVATCLVLMVPAVTATLSDIPQGGVIFIGEQGLNLNGVTTGSQVAWWGAGRSPTTDAPSDLQTISDPKNFFVSPTIYGTETGVWYTYPDKKPAFTIKDPTLAVKAIDVRTGREVTSGLVSRGDQVKFQVETNMYSMTERTGVNGVPVTIHVTGPGGIDYTSLTDSNGKVHSLDPVTVSSSLYETDPVWNTGNAQYPEGSYVIWAECNANNMKNEYPVGGKTTTKNTTSSLTVGTGEVTVALVSTNTATTTSQQTSPISSPIETGTMTLSPTTTTITLSTTGQISTPQGSPITSTTYPTPKAGGFTAGTTALLLLAGAAIALRRQS
ncbi:DUF3821 domain-containing protein [Methanosphaerula palustris]|nr:DUF3821 domain-containing protein [Methanosphaerula palustris]